MSTYYDTGTVLDPGNTMRNTLETLQVYWGTHTSKQKIVLLLLNA